MFKLEMEFHVNYIIMKGILWFPSEEFGSVGSTL